MNRQSFQHPSPRLVLLSLHNKWLPMDCVPLRHYVLRHRGLLQYPIASFWVAGDERELWKKSFLGHHQSDKIWPYMVMSECPNMVKHEKIREIVLFRGEGEVIVAGRMTAGRTAEVVRGKYQAKRMVGSDAPRSITKSFELPTLTAHNSKIFNVTWSAVESGIDRRGHARWLQKAQSLLPSDSWF